MPSSTDLYDVKNYTDKELLDILNLTNPTDRELEAKILHMIWKYENPVNNKSSHAHTHDAAPGTRLSGSEITTG
jgi:hypothetical protein